jgi:hypothetical protein
MEHLLRVVRPRSLTGRDANACQNRYGSNSIEQEGRLQAIFPDDRAVWRTAVFIAAIGPGVRFAGGS